MKRITTEGSTVIDKDSNQSVQNISQNLGVSNEETISALSDAGVNTSNASEVDAIAALIQKIIKIIKMKIQ